MLCWQFIVLGRLLYKDFILHKHENGIKWLAMTFPMQMAGYYQTASFMVQTRSQDGICLFKSFTHKLTEFVIPKLNQFNRIWEMRTKEQGYQGCLIVDQYKKQNKKRKMDRERTDEICEDAMRRVIMLREGKRHLLRGNESSGWILLE